MIYIISKDDLSIKDVLQSSSDEINNNISLTGKSIFNVSSLPKATSGDFIIQKDEITNYQGVIDNTETVKANTSYKINVNEIDSIFNRNIIISNSTLISTTGIEDFIKQEIITEFSNSDDALLNIGYIQVTALTHTPLNIEIETDNGIYNFMDFLGLVKQNYDIYLDYIFEGTSLKINISKKDLTPLKVDATISDVITYKENYKADIVAKVSVKSTNTGTVFKYFLLADQTISTDVANVNRAKGKTETVSCTKDSDIYQKALDTFRNSSYQHNVVLTLTKTSKLYQPSDFVIGRPLQIKTEDNGVYNTFVSEINKKSASNIYTVTCGNMKITLLEKLKGVV